MKKKHLSLAAAGAGLAAIAIIAPAQMAAAAPLAGNTYTNYTGSLSIATSYGAFGVQLGPGDVVVNTDSSGNVTGTSFSGEQVPDGGLDGYLTWQGAQATFAETSAGGSVGSANGSSATVSATGMQLNLTGNLCGNYDGFSVCDDFTSSSPLQVYISPTPAQNTSSTVSATGLVQSDGSFDVSGSGYVNVDTSTWTGTVISYVLDGQQINYTFKFEAPNVSPSAVENKAHDTASVKA